jgi:hypothetical protein
MTAAQYHELSIVLAVNTGLSAGAFLMSLLLLLIKAAGK